MVWRGGCFGISRWSSLSRNFGTQVVLRGGSFGALRWGFSSKENGNKSVASIFPLPMNPCPFYLIDFFVDPDDKAHG